MEKTWFYKILFFQEVIVLVKDKKIRTMKDTCQSMLVSFITGITLHGQEKSYQ